MEIEFHLFMTLDGRVYGLFFQGGADMK